MSDQRVVAAKPGDRVRLELTTVVGEKCDGNEGSWYCCTHEEQFENQLMKDFHVSDRNDWWGDQVHVLAWVCLKHGLETP